MKKKPIILGIESSCDETAASIIQEMIEAFQQFYLILYQAK